MLRAAAATGSVSDVVGPASATDGAAAAFDGTTGKLLKDSKIILTVPASAATLTLGSGKTIAINGSITLTGTDGQTYTLPATSQSIPGLALQNTWTAGQILTEATANQSILASTGYSLTGANTQAMLDFAGTINTSGASFDVIAFRITDTAHGASTNLFNIYGGSGGTTSQFSLNTSGQGVFAGGVTIGSANSVIWTSRTVLKSAADASLSIENNAGSISTQLTTTVSGTLNHGAANAASPAAQTIGFQGARAGTDTNVGGANATINPSLGTGTGTPANIVINGVVGATTGTGAQTASAAITVAGVVNGQLPSVVLGSAAIATNATDGFLYIPTCAGQPTGTPTSKTGRIPMVYDTTNHQFWFFDVSWKQPKTPAGAATVTWQ